MKQVPAWTVAIARDGDRVLLPRSMNLRIVNYLTPVWV